MEKNVMIDLPAPASRLAWFGRGNTYSGAIQEVWSLRVHVNPVFKLVNSEDPLRRVRNPFVTKRLVPSREGTRRQPFKNLKAFLNLQGKDFYTKGVHSP